MGNDDIDNLIDKDLYVKFGPNTLLGWRMKEIKSCHIKL